MPNYDYQCSSCKDVFEVFQSMSAKPLTKCPKCGKKVKRLISSGAGLIFKGSGFYATDYKKSSPKTDTPKPKTPSCPKAHEGCGGCPHSS